MAAPITAEYLKESIRRELPALLREDPVFRDEVLALTRQHHPTRGESEDWFHAMLGELRRDREEQTSKWQEQSRKWEEQSRRWEAQKAEAERDRVEQARRWEEQSRRWEEQQAQAELDRTEQARRWETQKAEAELDRAEQARRWEAQERKWEENSRNFDRVHEEIMAQAKKFDRGIGALGARWGIQSETAFRNALAGILEESFGVQVLNVNEFDDEGVVFGCPEQIELDLVIKNGVLLICELKSSIDKAGMYGFERKARFYEARHRRKAARLIVISPMVDVRARKVAERLGIEVYHDSTDVRSLDGS